MKLNRPEYWIGVVLLFSCLAETAFPQTEQEKKDRVKQIIVRADLDALLPARLEIEEGDYVILLRNGVYKTALTLVLDDDKAAKLAEKLGRAFSSRTQLAASLKPGRHIVRVAENPKMSMELIVVAARGQR